MKGKKAGGKVYAGKGSDVEEEAVESLTLEEMNKRLNLLDIAYMDQRGAVSHTAQILRRRFGLTESGEIETLDDIGQDIGVSRERIRQIQEKALQSSVIHEVFRDLDPKWERDA